MTPKLNLLDQFIAARVACKFAAKGKQSEAPSADLVKSIKAAMGKMMAVLKSKTGKPWKSLGEAEYDDGLLAVHFQGPTTKGTKSPVPKEPNGRFNVHFQVVKGGSDAGSVDITATYLPWVKDRFDFHANLEEEERGVELAQADDVAVKLLGELAGKVKGKMA